MNAQALPSQCSTCNDTGWDDEYDTPCYCTTGAHVRALMRTDAQREFEAHVDDALALFTQGE